MGKLRLKLTFTEESLKTTDTTKKVSVFTNSFIIIINKI